MLIRDFINVRSYIRSVFETNILGTFLAHFDVLVSIEYDHIYVAT